MKELKIEVPKGYVIDKENSTFECIKFKKKEEIKTWDDFCRPHQGKFSGYFISYSSDIHFYRSYGNTSNSDRHIYATEKEAISARAAAMISQLMPYYGGVITDEEWNSASTPKFTIFRRLNKISTGCSFAYYNFLAFRTEDQRNEFIKYNEQLVKDYLMID